MVTAMQRYEEAKVAMAEAKEVMRQTAKDAFAEQSIPVFENHPMLRSFSWTQYTPHFNDGEPCYFRSNTDYPKVVFQGQAESHDDEDGDSDGEISHWDVKEDREKGLTASADCKEAVLKFLESFDDETYEELFGDGVRVTVTSGGVEVDHYEHD
jgi:hypothetical protein